MSTHASIIDTGDVDSECRQCQAQFSYHVDGEEMRIIAARYPRKYCPICEAECEAERRQREAERRAKTWDSLCPKLYQESDWSRLPSSIVKASQSWQYGPHGLGFIGESGKGKTRCMFGVVRRMILDEGKGAFYLGMTAFSLRIAELGFEASPYIERLCNTDLLLMDDLGKGKLSDAVQAHLFHIVETRTANLLPILFTSNAGAVELAKMMSEDRAAPLLRRLAEFCETIKL